MTQRKSAIHHWWPRGLSKHWRNEDGMVGCLKSDGTSFYTQNSKLGGIRNAHAHKYTDDWESSPWNQISENLFQDVDDNISRIVKELTTEPLDNRKSNDGRWKEFDSSKWLESNLVQTLVSLCVRSPRTRHDASMLGRQLMGYERGSRTDLNVSLSNTVASFKTHSKSLPGRGKIGILRATNCEFIYGDGIYHNLNPSGDVGHYPRMFVPLTPSVAVIYCRPTKYVTQPMFSEIQIDEEWISTLNDLTQVYSEKFLFYKSNAPKVHSAFELGEFKAVTPETNVAIKLMDSLPGVVR